MSATYWLIERNSKHKLMPPTEPVLWFKERLCFAQGDKDIWTPHADKARHFSTKAAAEEYVRESLTGENYDPAPDVTGHMDCTGPTHAEIDATSGEDAALLEMCHGALRELVNRIEKCGASPELTHAVTLCSDLMMAVGNRWNPRDKYAAQRVRDELARAGSKP